MKRFNIVVGKKYEKDGQEKTQWNNVGTLVHFPAIGDKEEGYKLELNMFPNTKFSVFEQRDKVQDEGAIVNAIKSTMTSQQPDGSEPIDTEEIPF